MNKLLDREQSIKDLIYLFEQRNFLSCKNKLNQLKVIFPNDYFLENFDGVINANDELYDNAIVLFKNSIKLNPTFIDPYLNISKIFEKKKKYSKSFHFLKKLYREKKDLLFSYLRFADLFQRAKKFNQAILILKRIINSKLNYDNYYLLYHNVGSCYYSLKNYKLAKIFFLRSYKKNKNFSKTLISLGLVSIKLDNKSDVIYFFNLAIKIGDQLDDIYRYLGDFYFKVRNYKFSFLNYEKSLKIQPSNYKTFESIGFLYKKLKKYKLAEKNFLYALDIEPNSFFSNINIAETYLALLNHEEAEKYFDRSLKLDGNPTEALERYIFHSNYIPYFNKKKYSELIQRFYKLIKKKSLEKKITKKKKELYVGFVGATFFNHAVGFQILDVIKELNKNKNIKIFAYSNFKNNDFLRKEFKKNFYAWNDIDSLNNADAAKIIQGQNIDILIDLDGYTKNNSLKLFSFKPAPVQISWCGYLNSTGIKEIDYIIADQEVITKQTEDFYSEKILRLPNFFVNMSKPEGDLFISREIPAKKNKYITYCSFNNVLKYNLEVIKCWCEILESVKNSKLILLDSRYNEEEYCKYILEIFNNNKKKDILFNNNIIFLGYKNRKDLLEMYNKADIALDTFPYGGITTSLEAVYMGVPVLTIKGDSFFSRATFSLNRNLGLDNFIANDKDNYIKKAIELSKNLYKIQDIKDFLLKNKSNLDPFNSKKFAHEFLKLITSLKD